jgi:hypothetical protein
MKIKFILVVVSLCLVMGFSPVLADCPECQTQECQAGICAGDIDLDNCVDINDLTDLIMCVYHDSCPPVPLLCDIDGDCDVDEDDVDYMIDYLFNNGPMPKCPYCLYSGDPPQGSNCPCPESITSESIKSMITKSMETKSKPVK